MRGFTLVEMSVTLAISMILLFAASEFYLIMYRAIKANEIRTLARQDSNVITEYIAKSVKQAGGGSIPPWAALWIEDNCAARGPLANCGGSDRISLVKLQPALDECKVQSYSGPDRLEIDDSGGTCCLTGAHANQQAILKTKNFYQQVYLKDAHTTFGDCNIQFEAGQAVGGINEVPPTPAEWAGGLLIAANVSTVYLDSANKELLEFQDFNNDGVIQMTERETLGVNIVDFQAAVGFDNSPGDGVVLDLGDENDEWLFNNAADSFGGGGLAATTWKDVKMISIGVAVARRNPFLHVRSVTLLNGPERLPGTDYLYGATQRIMVRNFGLSL